MRGLRYSQNSARTVDGSGSCKDCAWGADAASVWMAQSQRLCEHAAKLEGIWLSTEKLRNMVGSLAQQWAQRESFVGNVIIWTGVIEWLTARPGVPVTTRAAGRYEETGKSARHRLPAANKPRCRVWG